MMTNDRSNTPIVVLIFCGLCVVAPVFLLLGAIFLYKHKISYALLLLFSLYFGWQYEPQMDLLNHYNQFLEVADMSLPKMWADLGTQSIGSEAYPVLFKYIVSGISKSPNVFSSLACFVYTAVFCLLLSSLLPIYSKKMDALQVVLLLGIVFTVEYVWFLGLRFWTGVFVFMYGYIQYTQKKKKSYLLICCSCLGFHFAHIILLVALLAAELFRHKPKVLFIFFFVCFLFRFLNTDILLVLAEKLSSMGYIEEQYQDMERMHRIVDYMTEYRAGANLYYLWRNEILFIGILVTYLWLRKNIGLVYNSRMFAFVLLLFSFANLGYIDMVFYERVCKIAVLAAFVFLFRFYSDYKIRFPQKECTQHVPLLLMISVFYALLTPLIAQREYLGRWELWVNSFFLL